LCDDSAGRKFAVLSNSLRPAAAVVDPAMTDSCPSCLTADSGIDALTHAVEAYTAIENDQFVEPQTGGTVYQGRNPMSDSAAENAIALIGRHLRRACRDGTDREARDGMSLAATFAGLAFSNSGVALVHAMEYALAEKAHAPHGRGCGLLLPQVMRFNLPARVERMARIAALLGEDTAGMSTADAAEKAVAAVMQLRDDIGIPSRMSAWGVAPGDIPQMARTAAGLGRIVRVNPRRPTEEDLAEIFRASL
jgi:alcohol dehydrogenase class IV